MKIKKKKVAAKAPRSTAAPKRTQFKSVTQVVGRSTIAYDFWKAWGAARDRADFLCMYDMTREGSSARESFGARESFEENVRRKLLPLAGVAEAEFMKLRMNGADEAHLIQTRGHQQRELANYTAERMVLLKGDLGFRIEQIDTITPERGTVATSISVEDFPTFERPEWFVNYLADQSAAGEKVAGTASAALLDD